MIFVLNPDDKLFKILRFSTSLVQGIAHSRLLSFFRGRDFARFFIKKPSKIPTSKKLYQSYRLPRTKSYLYKFLIIKGLIFSMTAMGIGFTLAKMQSRVIFILCIFASLRSIPYFACKIYVSLFRQPIKVSSIKTP